MTEVPVSLLIVMSAVASRPTLVAYIACGESATGMHTDALVPSGSGHVVDTSFICTGIAPERYMHDWTPGTFGRQSGVVNVASLTMPLVPRILSAARFSSRIGSAPSRKPLPLMSVNGAVCASMNVAFVAGAPTKLIARVGPP